jgi:Tol biopolymer transport system component
MGHRTPGLAIAVVGLLAVGAPPAAAQDESGLITFESNRDGPLGEIYTMRPDGSAKTRLTHNAVRDISAAWSANGSGIVFSRGLENWDLFRMSADGSEQKQLTATPDQEINAMWSPDGEQIAFERQPRGQATRGGSQVFVLDVDSGAERRLTTGGQLDRASKSTPAWSPDGSRIAYAFRGGGDFDIAITDVDSGETEVMTENTVDDVGPAWSPDGDQVAFSRRAGRGAVLIVADPETRREQRLTTGTRDAFAPSWSPNGDSITFSASNRRDTRAQGEYEILRVDLTTGAVLQLTTSYPGRDIAPNWGTAAQAPLARLALALPPDPPASFCAWTGTNERDTKNGSPYKRDVMCGKDGGDTLDGLAKADTLKGGNHLDVLYGSGGADDFVTRYDDSNDGNGDDIYGGTGADEAWIDCSDDVVSAAWRCG